jgi:predicted DNA-binding protein
MAATRTQIYLTRQQRARLDEIRRREGRSLAELVREAVDEYLHNSAPNVADALRETAGALPDLDVPPREEWDRARG